MILEKIEVIVGDITKLNVDAIINSIRIYKKYLVQKLKYKKEE